MKVGIAKFNAGIGTYDPVEPKGNTKFKNIVKGEKYWLPDDYNFSFKQAIFKPDEIKVNGKAGKKNEVKK